MILKRHHLQQLPLVQISPEQKAKIEQTAQAILDARAKHPECSLANLYDEFYYASRTP